MDSIEEYMPKFVGIYKQDEMLGKPWTSSMLKTHTSHLAPKGQLGIEKEAGQQNEIAANMLRQNHHEATSYGINDDTANTNTIKISTGTKILLLVMESFDTTPYVMYMGCTETHQQPNANTMKRIRIAKEKLESQKARVLKDPKDTKVADGTAVKEAREPTKAGLRKAKATGTTATEPTASESPRTGEFLRGNSTYYIAVMPASMITPANFQVHYEHKPHLVGSIQIEDQNKVISIHQVWGGLGLSPCIRCSNRVFIQLDGEVVEITLGGLAALQGIPLSELPSSTSMQQGKRLEMVSTERCMSTRCRWV
jgi:hypothetical protein